MHRAYRAISNHAVSLIAGVLYGIVGYAATALLLPHATLLGAMAGIIIGILLGAPFDLSGRISRSERDR
ncbi:MAG TPA: hypothetical protein VFL98_00590 [Candidatus Paceibacterota bacterium]|nr:hypothetical protein [Candidatus Paceibacterota bacterium]